MHYRLQVFPDQDVKPIEYEIRANTQEEAIETFALGWPEKRKIRTIAASPL